MDPAARMSCPQGQSRMKVAPDPEPSVVPAAKNVLSDLRGLAVRMLLPVLQLQQAIYSAGQQVSSLGGRKS